VKIALFLANAGRNSGGPEIYESQLVRQLARIDRENDYHLYCAHPAGPATVGVTQENFTFHVLKPSIRALSMGVTLPLSLHRLKPDVVHCTFVPPLFAPRNMAYTLPCTSVFQCPEVFPLAIRLRLQALCGLGVKAARLVFCISRHVEEYLTARLKVPADRLAYVPLAASEDFRPMTEAERRPVVQEKYGLNEPYFLFSGRWEPRKNVLRTLVAFHHFKRRFPSDVKLAFTGQRTWASRQADDLIRQLGLQSSFVDLGKTPTADLPALYSGAMAILFPSLWESFGLVLVEAMRCGTPVITSNTSAMPEIAGPGGVIVNPESTSNIADAMHRLSLDKGLRDQIGRAGLERGREFTWDRTARLSLDAYRRIVSLN
jgi:glycosyltransferase involved in cell wall biosynthesis